MIEQLKQFEEWRQQLSPEAQVVARDGIVLVGALVLAPIVSAMARGILGLFRFDAALVPPWRAAALKRDFSGERRRAWHTPPTQVVGWLSVLTTWAAGGCVLAEFHGRRDIIPLVQNAAFYVWSIAALILVLMFVGAWFSRRVQDLVEIPWLQESINHRLSGPTPGETFSFSVGRGITSLVYIIAVLTALLAVTQEWDIGKIPQVLAALLHLAIGALAAAAALMLGWIGVAWLRAEGRRSLDEELGENSTHLAVLGTVVCTTLLAIILLASRNLLPILIVVLGLAAVLWLLRAESGKSLQRLGYLFGSLLKTPRRR